MDTLHEVGRFTGFRQSTWHIWEIYFIRQIFFLSSICISQRDVTPFIHPLDSRCSPVSFMACWTVNEFCYCVLQLSTLPGARTLLLKKAHCGVLVRNFIGYCFEQEGVCVKYYIMEFRMSCEHFVSYYHIVFHGIALLMASLYGLVNYLFEGNWQRYMKYLRVLIHYWMVDVVNEVFLLLVFIVVLLSGWKFFKGDES